MLPSLVLLALAQGTIKVVPGSVQKVSQVTGETDRQRGIPTDNRTETKFGLRGTDLGASFEHEGKLVFLFGDTHPPNGANTPDRPFDGDSIAISTDKNPEDGLSMDFVIAADGKYLAVQAPGVSLKGFEVPNGGFSNRGNMYAYFTTDAQFPPEGVKMGRSVLIKSRDAKKWELVYSWSTDKFINISPAIVDCARVKGLPMTRGKGLLLFASGTAYRRSNVHLAFVPLDKSEDKSQIRYWSGSGWSSDEKDASPLFIHPEVGELSVAWCKPLEKWLMLYNCGNPRGITMRTADSPTGPWSESQVIFDPWKDGGYGKFIHIDWRNRKVDEVHDKGRENEFGGEYGPYMIPRFFKGDKKEATIYFLMSVWNPYNVVLMRAKLTQ